MATHSSLSSDRDAEATGSFRFAPAHYRDAAPALAPYAAALRACWDGDVDTELRLRSTLGEDEAIPIEFFLRTYDHMLEFERYALELARGRVLDLGAGAGPHSLALQDLGYEVLALDVCRDLTRLQRARGVERAICADFRYWSSPTFDTVLMLMNGLGPTATLDGLARFLRHAPRYLAPGGQLILDAAEAIPAGQPTSDPWPPVGDYAGQAWIELTYGTLVGRPFRELYVDIDTLGRHAVEAGWRFEIAFEGEEGAFLARLTLS